jgi:hypothetical protein
LSIQVQIVAFIVARLSGSSIWFVVGGTARYLQIQVSSIIVRAEGFISSAGMEICCNVKEPA